MLLNERICYVESNLDNKMNVVMNVVSMLSQEPMLK